MNQILADDIGKVDVYVASNDISSQDGLQLWDKTLSCAYSSNWVFFVDDYVFANWAHPCRYIFVNSETGEYQIVNETAPPKLCDFEKISGVEIPEPIVLPTDPNSIIETREPNPHLYAVIINGGFNDYNNHIRYWNDMSAIYCTITQVYGYMPENIYVHSTTGTAAHNHGSLDLDNDDIDDIEYPAYKPDIESTFQALANEMEPDDQLFVYVTDHGDTTVTGESYIVLWDIDGDWYVDPNERITSSELTDMLEPFNCAEIIVVMEQCFSGGFLNDPINIQAVHRTVHTACNGIEHSWAEKWITGAQYDEFVYYWTAAARGYYPGDHPWELSEYAVGEMPFTELGIPAFANHPPDYNPDIINGDGFIQMEEAFLYANNWDTWSPYGYYQPYYSGEEEHPIGFHLSGFSEDLLSLSGLCGNISCPYTLSGNFMVGDSLTIGPEVTLTLYDNSMFTVINDASVTLFGRSLVEVINSSRFKLEGGSSLYGTEHTIWEDPVTHERYGTFEEAYNANPQITARNSIPGDRIIISNNGDFDAYTDDSSNRITISAVGDNRWDGIKMSNSDAKIWFKYCDISKISHIKVNNGGLEFWYSTFSYSGQICSQNCYRLKIHGCTLENNSACPIVSYETSENYITCCSINNNDGNGISIYYPTGSPAGISYNNIQHNDYWGISYYDTPVYSRSNIIEENESHGFVALGSSGTAILGGNTIKNNDGAEIIGDRRCYPDLTSYIGSWGPNTIGDTNGYDPGSPDQYIMMCGRYDGNPIDVRDNIFLNENDPDFEDRFHPFYEAYIFDGEKPPEKILYEEGIAEIADSVYESAKLTMKEIVSDYPETEIAVSALQWLMYLEKFSGHDYAGLRDYIETVDEVLYPHLERVKYNTTTSSYMAEANYETAINRFEAILANPPSLEDSIFALIDEGYCYLKLDEQGGKSAPVECTFKPRCFEEFRYVSQNLTRNLLDKAIPRPEPSIPEVETFALYQNYPNPMRPDKIGTTTISFSIPKDAKNSEIKIYNIKGQLVKQFSISTDQSSIVWDGKDSNGKQLSNGIYLYKLDTGEKSITKKMILLR